MSERDLSQFLTNDEQALIEADRRITVARTLAMQANLLATYGASDDHIHDSVNGMRVVFDQLSTESIVKVQKSIADHTLALVGIQPIPVTKATLASLERVPHEIEDTLPLVENGSKESELSLPVQEATEQGAIADTDVMVYDEEPQQDVDYITQAAVENEEEARQVENSEVLYDGADLIVQDNTENSLQFEEIQRTPGTVTTAVRNLFKTTLTLEQCLELSYFDDEQIASFAEAVSTIYTRHATKKQFIPLQTSRIRLALQGAEMKQIAQREGSKSTAVQQSFYSSLPKFYSDHKQEVIDAFQSLQRKTVETVSTEQTQERPPIKPRHFNDATTVEMPESEIEEQLVSAMRQVYETNDPEALAGINDLFSTDHGVIVSSERSVEASRYFKGLMQRYGISLSETVDNPTARQAIARLLDGVGSSDDKKYFTLSEILDETPEGPRESKHRAVTNALNKIIRKFDHPSHVEEGAREKQVDELREELHKWLGLSQEVTGKIIDRALKSDTEYTAELGKALMQMYQIAAGVGLNPEELEVLRLFVRPQPSGAPRTVAEIRQHLKDNQAKNGIATKSIENGYVPATLLRAFDKIVVQRRDG